MILKFISFFYSIDSDFIDVPTLAKSTEPILLPSDDSHDIIETSINTSSEFIELDQDDESSHNSIAIEDIKTFIDNDKDQPSIVSSFDQLQAELIDDTAVQLTTARGNERLTATLTDTMHEDTQVISKKMNLILFF